MRLVTKIHTLTFIRLAVPITQVLLPVSAHRLYKEGEVHQLWTVAYGSEKQFFYVMAFDFIGTGFHWFCLGDHLFFFSGN